jgi:hypothetical protein
MAALYSPAGSPLLSTNAQALSADVLDAFAEAAERLQRLRGTRFLGEDAETAKLVVVYQVNALVGQGLTLSQVASVGRGSRSVSYKTDSGGRAIYLDERASQLREDLGAWPTVRGSCL